MQVKTEPLGDLPVISRLIESTGLVERIEEYFPRHHLWRGPGVGQTLLGLLLYIISEGDHRMYQVENWASGREEVLGWCLGNMEFKSAYLSDDRLGNLLDLLSKESAWSAFQKSHNESLIRIYELAQGGSDDAHRTVRIDTTTVQSDRPLGGLFGLGYNAHGSDMPQLKVVLLAMDKANFPLAMRTVRGDEGDDKLYTPVLEQAWEEGLARSGILVVGDSKLCNQKNMAFIAASENYYLGPLSQRQHSTQALLQDCRWIDQQADRPQAVMRLAAGAKEAQCIALVKELPAITMSHPEDENQQWTQRLFAVCSLGKREKQLKQLQYRIDSTRTEVSERLRRARGRKTLNQLDQAHVAVQTIMKKHHSESLFSVSIRPPMDKTSACEVQLDINEAALADERILAGWRVMATNAPEDRLSAYDAVLCYWEEYRIEQQFHLMLNKCTALMPIYLKKQNRILALTHLIMLALQYSNLWQHTLRQQLAQKKEPFLTQVVPGNPGMKVHNPTTKMILSAFNNIHFIHLHLPNDIQVVQIQGMLDSHLKLLDLLKLPSDLYMHPLCQRT
jgi:transposase